MLLIITLLLIWVLIKFSVPIMEGFLVIDKSLPHADALCAHWLKKLQSCIRMVII